MAVVLGLETGFKGDPRLGGHNGSLEDIMRAAAAKLYSWQADVRQPSSEPVYGISNGPHNLDLIELIMSPHDPNLMELALWPSRPLHNGTSMDLVAF
ncbi:hypothetical protein HAX54_021840, partial [Datura stramonium]|nr:hypothetical protein [Datura stramonium]